MAQLFGNPIDLPQTNATSNPPTGYTRVQAKTDGTIVSRSSAGVETVLTPSAGAVTQTVAALAATQANTTVTPAVLTGHTFTIPPGKTLLLTGQVVCTAAATTTGFAVGIRVAQGAGANANARGSWFTTVAQSSAAAASALHDGDVFNVAAGANALGELLGANSVAGNNGSGYQAVITNPSTNANTTVTVEFRSEVAGSAVTAQIGTSASAVIG